MYHRRTLEVTLEKLSEQFPVMLVIGSRQVGKTTCLRYIAKKNRHYVTLDDPVLASLAQTEPKLFLERFPPPLLIDEIQYAPQLLPYIKMHVDQNKKSGQFWLTGSEQFHLMHGVSESLAGRVGIANLLGLSRWEAQDLADFDVPFLPDDRHHLNQKLKHNQFNLKKTYETIWRGSYPALINNPHSDKELFYGSYVQTYLQRDVRHLTQVGNERTFLRFLTVAAARTAQLINFADMARDSDISPNTAKQWLSILQTSGICYFLEPYHHNITKRVVKTPKLYFLDTGLCTYLTRWSDADALESGAMSGAILETFVISELLKSYWHNGLRAPFYFYRDKDQKEIDLLITKNNQFYPIEIKKTASPTKDAVRHFSVLEKFPEKIASGAVICFCDTVLPITQQVQAIPISLI